MKNKKNQQGKTKKQGQQPYLPYLINDRSFKYFFSKNKEVLLCLLKVFLPLSDKQKVQKLIIMEDENTIQTNMEKSQTVVQDPSKEAKKQSKLISSPEELTFEDSLLHSPFTGEKQIALDLNVSINTGEKIDIEMHRRVGGDTNLSMFY